MIRLSHPLSPPGRPARLALYLLGLIVLLVLAAPLPFERNQEARVLETAREMLHTSLAGKILPHLNGEVRLQKPPLAYWLAAGSFQLLGVGVWQGRLPMALCALLTLAFTTRIALRLFSPRAAFFAGITLLSCLFFLQLGRLAETDILATCWITAAADAILSICAPSDQAPRSRWALYLNCHGLGACIGLAAMSKGLPCVFPLLLLVAWALLTRPAALLVFLLSGAILTALLVGAPWWIYASQRPEWRILEKELGDLSTGRDHGGAFYLVPAFLLEACLPWTPLLILSIVASIGHARSRPIRFLFVWSASIFLPLLAIPQKQDHYVLPLLPPLMILTGWMLDRALSGDDPPLARALGWVLGATTAAGAAAAPVLLWIGRQRHHRLLPIDLAAAALLLICTLPLFRLYCRRGLGPTLYAACFSTLLAAVFLLTFWVPSLRPVTFASAARQIHQRYGSGPYLLYPIENYRLNFELRQVMPVCPTPARLAALLAKDPHQVILSEQDHDEPAPLPPPLPLQAEFPMSGKTLRVYADR